MLLASKKNNNIELFILTTAITRPELHKISFNNYKQFIPKDINIKWIINIDFVMRVDGMVYECLN